MLSEGLLKQKSVKMHFKALDNYKDISLDTGVENELYVYISLSSQGFSV